MYIFLLFVFVVLLGLSLLNIVKAPTNLLWKLSVLTTEWGYILIFPTILIGCVLSTHFQTHIFLSTSLGISLFFLIPACQAIVLSRDLYSYLSDRLGAIEFRKFVFFWTKLAKFNSDKSIKIKTVVYKKTVDYELSLDIYQDESGIGIKQQPCVLVIHGGGWDSGDKTQLAPLNRELAQKGYTVVAIQYRLAPAYVFPAQIEDVNAALDFLTENAALWNIDASQFFLLGRSAGGQIAQVAAYHSKRESIKGVIAFYAPADLVWGYTIPTSKWIMDSNRVLGGYLGGSYKEAKLNYENATVSNLVQPNLPPILMLHGRADVLVTWVHNKRLIPFLEKAQIPYAFIDLPWAVHGFDFNINGFGGQISTYAVEYFLKRYTV